MPIEQPETFRRYRAPQEDGQSLIEPPLEMLPQIIADNRTQSDGIRYDIQGQSLDELRSSARRNVLRAAFDYTSAYRNTSFAARHVQTADRTPIILSGHQPQLFHPGVWYKNFVLGRVASDVSGVGVHLLIDSDLCRGVALRVPTGTIRRPAVETVPYDAPSADMPYEERAILDGDVFEAMGKRTVNAIRSLVPSPLVEELWPLVRRSRGQTANLGESLSRGRHLLETEWRNETLELPQSHVCRLPEFAQFAAHLLVQLPRFRAAHNGALAEYRRAHRLRNRAHPVPDLALVDDWHEAPFWIWSSDDPRRRAVFARRTDRGIEISDRNRRSIVLDLTEESDAANAVGQLVECEAKGIKLRTRALATTLFARLILGDLFLHGIGGAKYDQVTNLIARKFFGFELPKYAVVSATLRLPVSREAAGLREGLVTRQLRELRYHPERFLDDLSHLSADQLQAAREIAAQKQHWIETTTTLENALERHIAIKSLNEALQPIVEPRRIELAQLAEIEGDRRQADAIVNSREYSFCLYPHESIDGLLLDALRPRA